MPDLSMHAFDRDHVAGMRGTFAKSLELMLPRVSTRPDALATVADSALSLAGVVNALEGAEGPDVGAAVRTGGRAIAGLFAVARAEGHAITLVIDGTEPRTLAGAVHESRLHVGRWLQGFWAALAVRDATSLALLTAVPAALLQASTSRGDAYRSALADAARSLWTRSPDVGDHLMEALRRTDGSEPLVNADRTLDLDVPTIEAFFALLDADAEALDGALRKAIGLHRDYWGAAARRDDPDGFLALPLLALAATGARHGLDVGIISPYVPLALASEPAAAALVLCPYCLTPLAGDVDRCAGCLRDPRDDAPLGTDADSYERTARKACGHCAARIPTLAVVCATCRTRQ